MDDGGGDDGQTAHAGDGGRDVVVRAEVDPMLLARRAAEAVGRGGDPWRARELYHGMLPDHERVLGPCHPDTFDVLERLGHWAEQVDDFHASRATYDDLYRRRCVAQGEGHGATLDALRRLAEATGHAGDPVTACDLYVRLSANLRRCRGATHGETLAAMSRLAQWLACTGRPERARDLFADLALSLAGTPGAASEFARESLAYWQRWVGHRRFFHIDMHAWSRAARDQWCS